jgi:hypothetical protein
MKERREEEREGYLYLSFHAKPLKDCGRPKISVYIST